MLERCEAYRILGLKRKLRFGSLPITFIVVLLLLKMSNVFSSQRYVPASLLRTCSIVRVPFSELSRGSDAGIATLSLNHINLSMGEILLSSL